MKVANNVARMRKRFHELLDDTFSLFGSRRDSPVDEARPTPSEIKSHSAVNRYLGLQATCIKINFKLFNWHYIFKTIIINYSRFSDEVVQPVIRPRPKTSDPRRPPSTSHYSDQPRGAWDSKAPSPLVRPLSAGVINPALNAILTVDTLHVNAEGSFAPNDPAVPLIAAIKNEIGKCSLPGSTTDLIGEWRVKNFVFCSFVCL